MFERNETARVTSRQGSEKAEPPKYHLVSWLPKHGGNQKGLSRGLGSIENNDFNAVPFAPREGRRSREEKLERNDTNARAEAGKMANLCRRKSGRQIENMEEGTGKKSTVCARNKIQISPKHFIFARATIKLSLKSRDGIFSETANPNSPRRRGPIPAPPPSEVKIQGCCCCCFYFCCCCNK